jgi:hypothetical protein
MPTTIDNRANNVITSSTTAAGLLNGSGSPQSGYPRCSQVTASASVKPMKIAGTIHHCDQRHSAGLDLDNRGILGGVLHRLAPAWRPLPTRTPPRWPRSRRCRAFTRNRHWPALSCKTSNFPAIHVPLPVQSVVADGSTGCEGTEIRRSCIPYFIPSMGATVGDGQRRSAPEAPGSEPVWDWQARSETTRKRLCLRRPTASAH